MSNAMKKLKILHHLTAASANATSTSSMPPPPTGAASAQRSPTPPTSPIRNYFHSQSQNYIDVTNALRSARQALNSMQSPVQHQHQYHHQAEQFRPTHYNTMVQQQPRLSGAPICLLPQAFMVLTPNDPHPAICLPASPPQATAHMHHHHHHSTLIPPMPINPPIQQVRLSEQAVPRGNTTIYSSRPPPPTAPRYPGTVSYQHQPSYRTSFHKRPRLTTDAVSKIGKDSRMARWERVVGYVREQRKAGAESKDGPPASDPGEVISLIETNKAFIKEIERKNQVLDMLDYDEQERRSLWSGGSAGTNGVDEFVWSEDDDDDDDDDNDGFRKAIDNQRALDEHKRRLDRLCPEDVKKEKITLAAEEEGVFELEDGEATMKDSDISHNLTRASPKGSGSDKRPRSSPAPGATGQNSGGMRAYLEMLRCGEISKLPELKRESCFEGGLERLAGGETRRFSVY